MAVDQTLNLYEVTATVEASTTDVIRASDEQSAAELAEERITLTVDGEAMDDVVEIEAVSEVETRA